MERQTHRVPLINLFLEQLAAEKGRWRQTLQALSPRSQRFLRVFGYASRQPPFAGPTPKTCATT